MNTISDEEEEKNTHEKIIIIEVDLYMKMEKNSCFSRCSVKRETGLMGKRERVECSLELGNFAIVGFV